MLRFNPGDQVRYQPHYQPDYPTPTWDPRPWVVEELCLVFHRHRAPRVWYKVAHIVDGRVQLLDCFVREDQLMPWREEYALSPMR